MGVTTPAGRARLRDEVLARKSAMDKTKEQAAVLAGMSVTTWTKVEAGAEVQDRKYNGVDRAMGWIPGTAIGIATGRLDRSRTAIDSLHEAERAVGDFVGPSHEGDTEDEDTILLSLPPGLTPRQREQARIAGEAAARAVADALRGNDDGVQPRGSS